MLPTSRFYIAVIFVTFIHVSACRERQPQNFDFFQSDAEKANKFCEEQITDGKTSDGQEVVICKKLFSERPFVHVPKPNIDNNGVIKAYAGMYPHPWPIGGSIIFTDSLGTRYQVVGADGKPIAFTKDNKNIAALKDLKLPSYSYLFLIYLIEGKLGSSQEVGNLKIKTIHLSSAIPTVLIRGCALDSFLLGTWEGTVSTRLKTPQSGGGPFSTKYFDEAKRVPISISFSKISIQWPAGLSDWQGNGNLKDGDAYKLEGVIDNFVSSTTSVTGEKLPALKNLGEENPFFSAEDGSVELYRQSNMHGVPFDDHWVMTYPKGSKNLTINGMSFGLEYFDPSSLIVENESKLAEERQVLKIFPHLPYSDNGHSIIIKPVKPDSEKNGKCPDL